MFTIASIAAARCVAVALICAGAFSRRPCRQCDTYALDDTGSMAAKNKMVELKAAVKLLLATLKKNSKTSGDTKIAIVPFNTVVKVGTAYADAAWIEHDGRIAKSNRAGCVADRDQPNDVEDTTPNGSTATTFPVADCGALAQTLIAASLSGAQLSK